MTQVIAGERDLFLGDEEVGECRNLAVGNIRDMLKQADGAQCVQADPTGARNLHVANLYRRELKTRNDLGEREQNQVVVQSRHAFRRGIYGRLQMPELPDAQRVEGQDAPLLDQAV